MRWFSPLLVGCTLLTVPLACAVDVEVARPWDTDDAAPAGSEVETGDGEGSASGSSTGDGDRDEESPSADDATSLAGGAPSTGGTTQTDTSPIEQSQPEPREFAVFADFEEDFGLGRLESGTNRITRVNDIVYSGSTALRIRTLGEFSWAYVAESLPNNPPVEMFYFRLFLYIPEGAVSGKISLYSDTHGDSVLINLRPEQVVEVELVDEGRFIQSPPGSYREDEWMCFEAMIHYDNSDGEVSVSIDDSEVVSAVGKTTGPNTRPSYVKLGVVESREGQGEGALYFDDLAIDFAPIGCN